MIEVSADGQTCKRVYCRGLRRWSFQPLWPSPQCNRLSRSVGHRDHRTTAGTSSHKTWFGCVWAGSGGMGVWPGVGELMDFVPQCACQPAAHDRHGETLGARLLNLLDLRRPPGRIKRACSGYVACEHRNFPMRGRITSTEASNVEPHIAAHDPSARVHDPRRPHHLLLRNDLEIPPDSVRKPVWESGAGRLVGQVSPRPWIFRADGWWRRGVDRGPFLLLFVVTSRCFSR